MFKKILIANRGEIACRIIRTAKKLNIVCVAIYSDADRRALHVKLADEAYRVGPPPTQESYLNTSLIIETALKCQAQAIHPGYGFLSENAEFAEACTQAGLVFIGPSAANIRAMGSKSVAKQRMAQANVPLLPGYHGDDQEVETFIQAAKTIGYPVLLKAAAGGGGKGMRIVFQEKELAEAFVSAKREALASFGDDKMLVEKYLQKTRHIEVQIFADNEGNVVHLFDRECSIQRRHQKIIEEAPAPDIADALRKKMYTAAVTAAHAIAYRGAGTIEFLLDEKGEFYFMEMNTRLQVEHAVTEMITGQDLVAWQLTVAAGQPLPRSQKELTCDGHAIETRIYAEDPDNHFLPSTGKIQYLALPEENHQIRVDSGVTEGDSISIYYDPMIAKLISWSEHREATIQRMRQALCAFQVVGVSTNLTLLTNVIYHPAFLKADIDTQFIEKYAADLFAKPQEVPEDIVSIAAVYLLLQQHRQTQEMAKQSADPYSPWHQADGWQLNVASQQSLQFQYENHLIEVTAHYYDQGYRLELPHSTKQAVGELLSERKLRIDLDEKAITATIFTDKNTLHILNNAHWQLQRFDPIDLHEQETLSNTLLTSPMPGKIIALLATPGDKVERGDNLMVVEAMKMEHSIRAPQNGLVREYYYQVGDIVEEGVELLAFESEPSP